MGYIKKTQTLILLLMLAISLIAFGSTAIFYEQSLDRLTGEISENKNKITGLENTLADLYINFTAISGKYDLKVKTEAELSEKYTDIKGFKESLEYQNFNISSELNITKKDLISSQADVLELRDEVDDLNIQMAAFSQRVDNLTDELDDITDDIEDICGDAVSLNISKCEDYT
ncbi:MAG: hypothetical protein KKF44_04775 [Nanoarchaeota archaeon]|nr:hypothetical protein [Nanoarchaeota archaeon]